MRRQVIICGAGIAGVSAAYHLAVRGGVKGIVLVDERAPLTLTSDKSTECYRNWWPGPGDAMVALMNRSIDILEELADQSGNAFHLNRRGYLYATADPRRVDDLRHAGKEAALLGAGPLRVHPGSEAYEPATAHGYHGLPIGADLLLDRVGDHFFQPLVLAEAVRAFFAPGGELHRRCMWADAFATALTVLGPDRFASEVFARLTETERKPGAL